MRRDIKHVCFSYAPADDLPVVGGPSRFGFVSMVRLNLVQSLARRGVAVDTHVASDPTVDEKPPGASSPESATFAQMLRRFRLDAGLSQEALAERARISVNGLSALERGTRRTPQRETLALLVEALALAGTNRATFENAARTTRTPVDRSAPADFFDIALADVLVVVLTPAWLADRSCREQIARCFADPNSSPKRRVMIVRREPIAADVDAASLENLARFDFFREAGHARANEPYYRNDGTALGAFYDVVESLSQAVHLQLTLEDRSSTLEIDPAKHAVFVAPPASDMEAPYRTLVAELRSAGYTVLPVPSPGPVNLDETDVCLTSSLCSIHLLGEEDTFDDAGRSHVNYPLARAAARTRASEHGFRRIVFAPKLVAGAERARAKRDPIEVRDRHAEPLTSDTICGDGISDFIFAALDVIRLVERRAPARSGPASSLEAGNTVFVNFHPGDVRYARDVAKALRERGLRARFAAFEDDKIANKIANAGIIRDSQAVVHCWANSSDAWLYSEAAEFDDWRRLGRAQPFHARAAIAGPPERVSKMLYSPEEPPEAIDVYLDLVMRDVPLASDLEPIVSIFDQKR